MNRAFIKTPLYSRIHCQSLSIRSNMNLKFLFEKTSSFLILRAQAPSDWYLAILSLLWKQTTPDLHPGYHGPAYIAHYPQITVTQVIFFKQFFLHVLNSYNIADRGQLNPVNPPDSLWKQILKNNLNLGICKIRARHGCCGCNGIYLYVRLLFEYIYSDIFRIWI